MSLKSNTKPLKAAKEELKKTYEALEDDDEDKISGIESLEKGFFVQAHLVGDKYYVALSRGPLSLNLIYQIQYIGAGEYHVWLTIHGVDTT